MLFREMCRAAAIACLKGTVRQKRVAYAFTTEGNGKQGAKALGMPLGTFKTHLQRLYVANGVGGIRDLQASGHRQLLRFLARENPGIRAKLSELAAELETLIDTGE